MVLASEQDPDLELVSDFDEGPPVLTPIENTREACTKHSPRVEEELLKLLSVISILLQVFSIQ